MSVHAISNEELRLDHLPEFGDDRGIFRFAMTYNGYEIHGDKLAEYVAQGQRCDLSTLRAELFFAARSSRHMDTQDYIPLYEVFFPSLKEYIEEK